jgi:hypothetical protein
MNIGEFGNFLSYAYAPASVVAPLGTVSNPMLEYETWGLTIHVTVRVDCELYIRAAYFR